MGKKGRLFVISAPSGSGKTTLCQRLISGLVFKSRLVRSVSCTTRLPRKGERQGQDYFFISREEFIRRRKRRQFLEWAEVLGNFYGTPRDFVLKQISRGRNVLLSIDVQGAMQIKRKLKNAVFVFILPPSLSELRRRLKLRCTETSSGIARRLKLAKKEIAFAQKYDYAVLNDKLGPALARLKEIIKIEKEK